ncbi:hypothetical protein HY632_03455 [Candidatus Uhrbacteria bacterium]|nr:hypothetical protein [Candidatus Uhrbacteria bacterium]
MRRRTSEAPQPAPADSIAAITASLTSWLQKHGHADLVPQFGVVMKNLGVVTLTVPMPLVEQLRAAFPDLHMANGGMKMELIAPVRREPLPPPPKRPRKPKRPGAKRRT